MISTRNILLFLCILITIAGVLVMNALAFPPAGPPEEEGVGTASVYPESGPPCSTVRIEGSGFTGLRHFRVSWMYQDHGKSVRAAEGSTDEAWALSADITVPADAQPGTNRILVNTWTIPCESVAPGQSCVAPAYVPSSQKWIPFEVTDAGVGEDAYCPEVAELVSGPPSSQKTGVVAAESGNASAASTRTTLPATGLNRISILLMLLAAVGTQILLLRASDK